MAKALVGFIGGPASTTAYETAQLRRKVADLQAEVHRLKTENEVLLNTLAERVDAAAADLLEPAH